MLTQSDLRSIGNLIDERLEIKLEEKLESKLEEKLESKLEEKLSPIRKDIKTIRRDLKRTIDYFDKSQSKIVTNVRKIQENLNMPIMDFV